MPLTPCKECGREISNSAATCPHCGVALPALTDTEKAQLVKLSMMARSRHLGGAMFLFGFLGLGAIALTTGSRELFVTFWDFAKWLMGVGAAIYILAEIQRNIEVRKAKRSQ